MSLGPTSLHSNYLSVPHFAVQWLAMEHVALTDIGKKLASIVKQQSENGNGVAN